VKVDASIADCIHCRYGLKGCLHRFLVLQFYQVVTVARFRFEGVRRCKY